MAQFSRATLFEACNLLGNSLAYHGQVEDLFYRWELEDFAEKPAGRVCGLRSQIVVFGAATALAVSGSYLATRREVTWTSGAVQPTGIGSWLHSAEDH
jgi:hypothetical protein